MSNNLFLYAPLTSGIAQLCLPNLFTKYLAFLITYLTLSHCGSTALVPLIINIGLEYGNPGEMQQDKV